MLQSGNNSVLWQEVDIENSQTGRGSSHKLTFEEAFSRLEEVVQRLEQGGLSLDDATGIYEEGINLGKLCSEMLAATELKISKIQTSYAEQIFTAEVDLDQRLE